MLRELRQRIDVECAAGLHQVEVLFELLLVDARDPRQVAERELLLTRNAALRLEEADSALHFGEAWESVREIQRFEGVPESDGEQIYTYSFRSRAGGADAA